MGCSGSKSTQTESKQEQPPSNASSDNKSTEQQSKSDTADLYVTVEEASEYLENELGISPQRAQRIIGKMNKNQDDKLSKDELTNLWKDIKKRKDAIREEFKKFDSDNTGRVVMDDAVKVLSKICGGNIPDAELLRMLKAYDLDQNDKIDYEEFTFFYSAIGYRRKEFGEHWFKKLDTDDSGDLDPEELTTWLNDECALENYQSLGLINTFDRNNDGKLCRNEFQKFFEHLFKED